MDGALSTSGSGGGGGKSVVNKTVNVPATATGTIWTAPHLLSSSSTFQKNAGSDANLSVTTSTGAIAAATAIGAGNMQVLVLQETDPDGRGAIYKVTYVGGAVAPAAPAVTLAPGNGQISVAWVDGSTGGSPITAHGIYVNGVLVASPTSASPYLITGLTNGTSYSVQVSALNSVGESALSAAQSATPTLAAFSFVMNGTTPLTDSINGNGWTGTLTVPNTTIGKTSDATKLSLIVEEPAFDSTGTATTVTRTIAGTAQLRRAAPNQATLIEAQSGSDALVTVTLAKRVGKSARLVSMSALAGVYGSSGAGAVAVPTTAGASGSALDYFKPIIGWFTPQFQAPTGSTFNVELFATHHHRRANRQVACVEFRIETLAGLDQGISVKVATMTQSAQSPNPVPCYAGAIPLAGLTQGQRYIVRAKAYPFIGDSTAIADTGPLSGDPPSAAPMVSLTFVCDKNGTYGDAVAFVKKAASGGTVGNASNLAAARATPFPTAYAAANALKVANNAKAGGDQHNDAGGATIYYMEDSAGAGADHAGMGNTLAAATAGAVAWLHHRVDPAATGVVRIVTGAQKNPGRCSHFANITFDVAVVAGNANDYIMLDSGDSTSTNLVPIWLDNCTHLPATPNSGAVPFAKFGLGYYTRGNYVNNHVGGVVGNVRSHATLALGVNIGGATPRLSPFVAAGCTFPGGCIVEDRPSGNTVYDFNDGAIFAYNAVLKQNTTINLGVVGTYTYNIGIAIVKNLVEMISSACRFQLGADNAQTNFNYALIMGNTVVGERANICYVSSGIAASTTKNAVELDTIFEYRDTKGDVFYVVNEAGSSGVGRTGNFPLRYNVDNENNVVRVGGFDGATTTSPSSWLGEVPEVNSKLANAVVTFVDDNTLGHGTGAGSAAGISAYIPNGATNDAYSRIPAGSAGWPFGLDGRVCLNDGTGAAGAMERA